MDVLIQGVRNGGDSIGGIAEFVARGCPAGLGEPVFEKLKASLAHAFLGIPAVVGFEYGSGFQAATMRGSEHNDAFVNKGDRIGTESNRHGGMLGGISSGEPIVVRACVKPTSSIAQPQRTVRPDGQPTEIRVSGRHDPCLLPRFIPIGEAMIALVLVDHLMRWRAQLALAPTSMGRERSSSDTEAPGSDTLGGS
jgi:chorismate synthase